MWNKNYFFLTIAAIVMFKLAFSPWKGWRELNNIFASNYMSHNDHYKELVNWSKQSDVNQFVVPPLNTDFYTFRFFSKKSVWATAHDINQLAYSPDYYLKSIKRLQQIGFSIVSPHNFTYKMNLCSLYELNELNSFGIIVHKVETNVGECFEKYEVLFENLSYLVLRKK